MTSCGIVAPTMGTRIICLRASSPALRMASGTSPALPVPAPTVPRPSPTTTTALKLNLRPPFTTLATRFTCTNHSSKSVGALSILAIVPPMLEVEPALASALGQCLDAAVVQVPAAVENYFDDARSLCPLGHQLAHRLSLFELGCIAHSLIKRRCSNQR